jgi:HK97 gp10 family phage protein
MSFADDITRAKTQLAKLEYSVVSNLDEAAKAGAEALAEEARKRAPVRTGKLKASIATRKGTKGTKDRAEWVVFTGVFYAHFVEYGTRKMSKRPYMRPAVDAGGYLEAIEAVLLAKDGI